MFEIHLFVNPLDSQCMQCEQDALKFKQNLNGHVRIQFLPLVNMQTVTNTIKQLNLDPHNLPLRNRITQHILDVALDYKAASFQGRKKGRSFLFEMQDAIMDQGQQYSSSMSIQIARELGLDAEMFSEDRASKLAKNSFKDDQKLAQEMGVTDESSAVVFNSTIEQDGILIPNFSYKSLTEVCSTKLDSVDHFVANLKEKQHPSLHII